jgi:hypothetical protein
VEAHEESESINWSEFRATFCAHHVPQGVIKLRKEFQDLKQGSMSMNEYVTKFIQLSRKRKLVRQHQLGSSFAPCVVASSAGPVFCPAQLQFQPRLQAAGQGFSAPQRQVIQCPNNLQTATATPAPTSGANSIPVAAKQNYAHGRVNYVAMEEAREALDVVIGIFFINDTSVVVLFDSGASYSFISAAYGEKHNLPMALLRCQMIVSSPGGDMPARQLCPKVNLKIRGLTLSPTL